MLYLFRGIAMHLIPIL
ncbi:MAG: hypothetical protein ACOX2E_11375 [Syntrophaceticus sp.]